MLRSSPKHTTVRCVVMSAVNETDVDSAEEQPPQTTMDATSTRGAEAGDPGQGGTLILAVIVTYYPDAGFSKRVSALAGHVDEIFIIDNTPAEDASYLAPIDAPGLANKVKVRALGRNIGIAAALNLGVDEAKYKGFQYLLTLDQDSSLPPFAIRRLLATLASEQNAAVVCPLFHERSSGRRSFFAVKKMGLLPRRLQPNTGIHSVYAAITSGSLYSVATFDVVGKFEEHYFIDCVDHEHCLRTWRRGLRVLVDSEVDIEHALGRRSSTSRGGITFSPTNYPPVRYYYMMRNRVFLYKKHGLRFPLYVLYDVAYVGLILLRVIFAEQNRRAKFRLMIAGAFDGLGGLGGACRRV